MPVSVTMPRLGESVTEGTVTRWLKQEGDQVSADEPLLEVSTDKVDTEVPSPASGILSSIKVAEDETVEIGVELAVISEEGEAGGSGSAQEQADVGGAQDGDAAAEGQAAAPGQTSSDEQARPEPEPDPQSEAQAQPQQQSGQDAQPEQQSQSQQAPAQQAQSQPAPPAQAQPQPDAQPQTQPAPSQPAPAQAQQPQPAAPAAPAPAGPPPAAAPPAAAQPPAQASAPAAHAANEDDEVAGTYVTPLVRKLASEHGIDLNTLTGTGVGGRIRKSDVLSAATAAAEAKAEAEAAAAKPAAPAQATPTQPVGAAAAVSAAQATQLRGQTVKLSRLRQVIASRMVESLHVSAQLTTVVEVDVTRIARLRDAAKADFERREGVKLSFLPFFAIATVEALREHPNVNCSVDTEAGTVTYHDAEHLGIAVDTERGLLVPVIHNAGDLNLGGIARKIADLAERTRTNKVSPDELGGGTFTLTNTGSRGALFDTPIINQPQVGILGTGSVVKRPVVISDPNLGETIAVRSMVYLALSYDHRIVDGADAARFLTTMKTRLEAGDFERDLGLS
jgi:pyruvate dehydrogenase E2 component (dihydrolipoamide acetyltransferase)